MSNDRGAFGELMERAKAHCSFVHFSVDLESSSENMKRWEALTTYPRKVVGNGRTGEEAFRSLVEQLEAKT